MTAPVEKDNKRYRKLREVEILDVKGDGKEITFVTDARLCDATNNSEVSDRRVQGTFVVRTEDLYVPKTGSGLDESVKFEKGARGRLYIEETASQVKGTSSRGSVFARGVYDVSSSSLLKDEMRYRPKWPDGGASGEDGEGLYDDLEISAESMWLIGYVPGSTTIGKIDLLDKKFAPAGQLLAWKGGRSITVKLEKDGVIAFKGGFAGEKELEIWVVEFWVSGKPTDGGSSGKVDLRNLAHSSARQDITTEKSNPVPLALSAAGKKQFNWYDPNVRATVTAFAEMVESQSTARQADIFELTRKVALVAAQLGEEAVERFGSAESVVEFARELRRDAKS